MVYGRLIGSKHYDPTGNRSFFSPKRKYLIRNTSSWGDGQEAYEWNGFTEYINFWWPNVYDFDTKYFIIPLFLQDPKVIDRFICKGYQNKLPTPSYYSDRMPSTYQRKFSHSPSHLCSYYFNFALKWAANWKCLPEVQWIMQNHRHSSSPLLPSITIHTATASSSSSKSLTCFGPLLPPHDPI